MDVRGKILGAALGLFTLLCFTITAHAGVYTILYEFQNDSTDGGNPVYTKLTPSGSTLYGMTYTGPDIANGLIFKINSDGSGYTHLYSMSEGPAGKFPYGSLTFSAAGDKFYGVTAEGGNVFVPMGNVFEIGTDGSSYTQLHEFDGTDGSLPFGSLTLSGADLYGMIYTDGPNNVGSIFKVSTSGSNFTLIHAFEGDPDGGANPIGDLTLSGSTFYGMTNNGGTNSDGAILSIGTGGSGFTLLHSFGVGEAYTPYGSLLLNGTDLYGMTRDHDYAVDTGAIFKIGIDGLSYTILHTFSGGATDGEAPYGNLALYDGSLYGMTQQGGDSDFGTIFKIDQDGSNYTVLYEFLGGTSDGKLPEGSLTFIDSTMYGMTRYGGDSDVGVIFSFAESGGGQVPEPSTLLLLIPLLGGLYWMRKRRK
ncbi:choice-of-anchor tandem repeat GloVer-containing protein [Candidatus Auribacterota bacterium]